MSKLVELKYVDAQTKTNCNIIFNCDNVSTIELEHTDATTTVCSVVINMNANAKRIAINFIDAETRDAFLSELADNLTNTKSDGFVTIEF